MFIPEKSYTAVQNLSRVTIPTGNLYKNITSITYEMYAEPNYPLVEIRQNPREQTSTKAYDLFSANFDVLKEKLEFLIDGEGNVRLSNANEVLVKWKRLLPSLKNKYKSKDMRKLLNSMDRNTSASFFEKIILQSFPYNILFFGQDLHSLPSINKESDTEESNTDSIKLKKNIPDFMLGIDIPISVEAKIKENNPSEKEVSYTGKYLEDPIIEKKLKQSVVGMLGRINVYSIPKNVRYLGSFMFDQQLLPQVGGLLQYGEMQGLFIFESQISLKQTL